MNDGHSNGMSAPRNGNLGLTTSDGVRQSYYGRPVIKPAHWGWLVITYLFLGGIAGASYTIGTLASIFARDRSVERAARYIAFVAFQPCPPLLVLDLGRPDRFLNMMRIVKLRSPMSLGSWALVFVGGISTLSAALQLLADVTRPDMLRGTRRLIGILGLPFSVFLSGYTGVLLAATNVPLWWRSFPLLSPTFIGSAYSTSLATLSLITGLGHNRDTEHRLARAEAICIGAELTFMTAALIRLGKIGRPLTTGKLGTIFWPVTYFGGMVVPLALQLSGPARGREVPGSRRVAAGLLALIGGFSLRALMILAGRESAKRPEDYFAMTGGRSVRP